MSPTAKIVSSDSDDHSDQDQDPLIVSDEDTLDDLTAYSWTKKICKSVIIGDKDNTIQPQSDLTVGVSIFTVTPLVITLSNALPFKLLLDIEYKINNVFSQK